MGPYDLGAPVPSTDLDFDLFDDNGNLVNVSGGGTATLTITQPDGTAVTPAVANPSVGLYLPAAPYVTAQPGHHQYAWVVTGTYRGAFVDSFEVRTAPDTTIVSMPDAREILKLTGTEQYDSIIRGYNQSATEYCEYVCGAVVTRQYTETVRSQGTVLVLGKTPVRTDLGTTLDPSNRRDGSTTNGLVSITPLLSYGFMYDLSQLLVDGGSGIVRNTSGLPFFYSGDHYGQYLALYWVGRRIIPWGIYEASKIILKHLWMVERGQAGGLSPGEEETTQTGFGFAVPNRAMQLLAPHSGKASRAAIA